MPEGEGARGEEAGRWPIEKRMEVINGYARV